MLKKIIFAAILLTLGAVFPLQASNDYEWDNHLTELRKITSQLTAESLGNLQTFSEDRPKQQQQVSRLIELTDTFIEALEVINMTRTSTLEGDASIAVIVGHGTQPAAGFGFTIFISHERYLELADLISEFTGIPIEHMHFDITDLPRLWIAVDDNGTIALGVGAIVEVDWCPDEAVQEAMQNEDRRNTSNVFTPGTSSDGIMRDLESFVGHVRRRDE